MSIFICTAVKHDCPVILYYQTWMYLRKSVFAVICCKPNYILTHLTLKLCIYSFLQLLM